ncbi:hypothetical protein Pint_09297 [Pistacia integerrima]|uniref:Uncharacterized protein n=1 Tax=Pistacia integerrima TaxID=434235 RepID=A0ACC0XZQ7_9ROSI|nr:hypothetical protein Pint_09297 [Pistacia integerrima]
MIKVTSCSSLALRVFKFRFLICNVQPSQSFLQFHTYSNLDSLVSTFIAAITSCSSVFSSRAIHARIIKSLNYREGFIGDQLVSCYFKLGCEEEAEKLFDEMPEKDLASWNSLISGYSRNGHVFRCLIAFNRMKFEQVMQPNDFTLLSIISACTDMRALDEGKYIHGIALKLGMLCEPKVVNALINLYGKCGFVNEACGLFEAIPGQSLVSWNSIIAVYTQNGFAKEGMRLFNLMRRAEIKPDQATMLALLQGYEDLGIGKLADMVHGFMLRCGLIANVTISTALLMGDQSHLESEKIYKKLEELIGKIRVAGFASKTEYVLHDVEEEVKEDMINKHSEKLAIAFGLLVTEITGDPLHHILEGYEIHSLFVFLAVDIA